MFAEGTFLAQRWKDEGGVNLYHSAGKSGGFFVEVGYEESWQCATVLRSFVDTEPLEDYLHGFALPTDN